MRDQQAIELLLDAAGTSPGDEVLDAACGPGLVALAFTAAGARVTAVDATPAMIERGRQIAREQGSGAVNWQVADLMALPFAPGRFQAVVCRFAVHHLLDPAGAVSEMRRVLRPGGRLVLCDGVADPHPDKARAFNAMERLRDPSTVKFLTEQALVGLLAGTDLRVAGLRRYRVPVELEGLMAVSFPDPGQEQVVRRMIEASVADDALGLGTRRDGGRVLFHYPATIVIAQAPG